MAATKKPIPKPKIHHNKAKTAKLSLIVPRNILKPESKYRARAVKTKPKKNYQKIIFTNIKKININLLLKVSLAVLLLVYIIFMIGLYLTHKDNKDRYRMLEQTNNLQMSQILAKQAVIGTREQLKSEIINSQSAPEDLTNFIIVDYAKFKSSCIVNGKLIGPASYEITNVVYDKYAKIHKNCNGADEQILVKLAGSWMIVATGRGAPNCDVVNSLGIPMGISPTCTDGKILYPNPNP